ncbi:hypothetical protein BD414DRAFT_535210 [Trametes punicea]|nr:hypothetical protein BD414DRAFT_535210 [Trametes punicea]
MVDISPDEDLPMTIDDDNSVTLATDSDLDNAQLEWEYTCLRNIKSVVEACDGDGDAIEDALIVRLEYKLLIETLETGYLERANATVVTGQPGIGKTVSLIYLLLYRLERKLPTASQRRSDTCVVFDADGAAVYLLDCIGTTSFGLWRIPTLVSSSHANSLQKSGARSFQASSPRPDRWKDWIKYKNAEVVVSDLLSLLEIGVIV